MSRIAVIGAGWTRPEPARPADTFADLVREAVAACLEDARAEMDEIDNIVTVSNDFMDGRTISSMAVGDAAGAAFGGGKSVSTVEGDGAFGAVYGMSRILSGAYRTTLVVAHSKASEGDQRLITNAWFDPINERTLGLDAVSAAALQARLFLERSGLPTEALAEVVSRNRAHAAANPAAPRAERLSAAEAEASPWAAPPLREADISPPMDGAAALLLASEDFLRGRETRPVWVAGAAFQADARMTDRDLSRAPAIRGAADRALRMAGLDSLDRSVDFVELDESFSYQQPLWLEELGLAGRKPFPAGHHGGYGAPGLAGLAPERINPSGGSAPGRVECAAGLIRIGEAVRRLRAEGAGGAEPRRAGHHGGYGDARPGGAEPRRAGHHGGYGDARPGVAEAPRRALAHGASGPCGQSHCVWILSN